MTTAVIEQEAKQETSGIVEAAQAFQIVDNETLVRADQEFNRLKEKKKIILSKLDPIRDGLEQEKKRVIALIKELTGPCDQGCEILEKKILAYRTELHRLEEEEQRRLQAIKDAEAIEAAQAEADELLRQAEAAEKSGDEEGALAIIEEAAAVEVRPTAATVQVQSSAPKLSSTVTKRWKWRIKDQSKIKKEFLIVSVNEVAINSLVKTQGKRAELIVGGIEAYEEEGLSKGRK